MAKTNKKCQKDDEWIGMNENICMTINEASCEYDDMYSDDRAREVNESRMSAKAAIFGKNTDDKAKHTMSEVEKYEWIETREESGECPATVEFSPADNETDICERARYEKRSADGGESEVMSESENRLKAERVIGSNKVWYECRAKDIPPKRGSARQLAAALKAVSVTDWDKERICKTTRSSSQSAVGRRTNI